MKLLVLGKNSSVGKELAEALPPDKNHIYVDSQTCDLLSEQETGELIWAIQPDVVIMLAATVGGIFDNVNRPYDYLTENVRMQTNVIEACRKNKVGRLLTLSSSCAYPDRNIYPSKEHQLYEGAPARSNLGYGLAKRLLIEQIQACNSQYGTNYSCLIPTNLYGKFSKYDEHSHFLGKLIRKIADYNAKKIDKIEMMGGSSAVRSYLYIPDLVQCIKLWLDDTGGPLIANISPIEKYSIKVITRIALDACNCDADVKFLDEGMAGQINKEISSDLLMSRYSGMTFTSLRDGIRNVYEAIC